MWLLRTFPDGGGLLTGFAMRERRAIRTWHLGDQITPTAETQEHCDASGSC